MQKLLTEFETFAHLFQKIVCFSEIAMQNFCHFCLFNNWVHQSALKILPSHCQNNINSNIISASNFEITKIVKAFFKFEIGAWFFTKILDLSNHSFLRQMYNIINYQLISKQQVHFQCIYFIMYLKVVLLLLIKVFRHTNPSVCY